MAATNALFVHLKVHSAYSLLEGALRIETLAKLAKGLGMPALALTDTGNLFGALEFAEKMAASGIQPIMGLTLAVDFGEDDGDPREASLRPRMPPSRGPIALLAKDEAGYQRLMALSSSAFLDTPENEAPRIPVSALEVDAAGLIALSGGPDGPIDTAILDGRHPVATARLERLQAIFGDRLYVELQRHGLPRQAQCEPHLVDLAYRLGLPLVATNEAYFAAASDYEAHDALICVAEGRYVSEDDRRRLSREHYFKTGAEMTALFKDLPEAIESTVEIARRSAYRPRMRKPILPQFVRTRRGASADAQAKAEADELRRQAAAGLERRLAESGTAPGLSADSYRERLAYELSVIVGMQYQGYFLIVADFIQWAKAQGIPVGPGRGSGAGSLAAYSLTITDLDPLRFGLLFERFLNPERVSMPDFDIDFCQERRDEVIRYVQGKYGADRVAQIITFGKLQARAVLRDVGRVLSMPYGQVDKLCKLVPNNPANPVSLEQAIEIEPRLQEARDAEPLVARLLGVAQKLEGLYRHASTHAAGVVIADRPLTELVPLYRDPRSSLPATQYNMKWVEQAGLVKFDFLGLKTLSVIDLAVKLLARRGVTLELARLPLDDEAAYALMSRGDTVGIFQLESTGMRDSLRKLKPDRFEDVIAMVSLYRPGPMEYIPIYINRKHGLEAVDCLHPRLEGVLKETYGVVIYQEQVQQIAKELAGYSLGEADLLRRAMGKKIKEEMAQQRHRFVDGAVASGVEREQAQSIFDKVDKFAGYGFNKSHGAAYALVAYHTAYLKANFPVEFLAASMTFETSNTDKLGQFVEEARRLGIAVLPPDLNASEVTFVPEDSAIRYALAAVRNVGEGVVGGIVGERAAKGPFRDLGDLARRIDPSGFNKRTLESLAAAGALDSLDRNRALVHANAENLLSIAQRRAEDAAVGQSDLFGGGAAKTAPAPLQLRSARAWSAIEELANEFEAIGFYLTGHPLDEYEAALKKLGVMRYRDFEASVGPGTRSGVLAGIVTMKRERRSKSGNRFAFAGFSDQTGQFEAVVFSDVLIDAGDLLEVGSAVVVHVEAEREGDTVKLRAQLVQSLDKAAGGVRNGLRVVLDGAPDWANLEAVLKRQGSGRVELRLALPEVGREVTLRLPNRIDISPSQASTLRSLAGVRAVQEF